MSDPTIITLPDVPLLNILKRVPLKDLVYGAARMCRRMRAIVPIELARRRSLVLTHDDEQSLNSLRQDKAHSGHLLEDAQREDGSPVVRHPTLQQYKFAFVPLEIALQGPALMNALPGISRLTVSYTNISPSSMSAIIRMLNRWSETLVSLTLILEEISQFGTLNDLRLFEAINRLSSLRHLKIGLARRGSIVDPFRTTPNLEFISRLVTLCVQGDGIEPNWLFDSLAQHGTPNMNIRKVCYHHNIDYFNLDALLDFGLENPRLANCFTFLETDVFRNSWWNDLSAQTMERLCTRFNGLTTLALTIIPSAMGGIAQQLRRLPHLDTLRLAIFSYQDGEEDEDPTFDVYGWPILNVHPVPLDEQLLVRSVRVLELDMFNISHENIRALRIAEHFQNINVLSVIQDGSNCSICTPNAHHLEFTIYICLLMSLRPFRECPHLSTIYYTPGLGPEFRRITPQDL